MACKKWTYLDKSSKSRDIGGCTIQIQILKEINFFKWEKKTLDP